MIMSTMATRVTFRGLKSSFIVLLLALGIAAWQHNLWQHRDIGNTVDVRMITFLITSFHFKPHRSSILTFIFDFIFRRHRHRRLAAAAA
jgi:hypothetical protein